MEMKIIDIIKFHIRHNLLVLYRGDEELEFVKNFLKGVPEKGESPYSASDIDSAVSVKDLIDRCQKCRDPIEKKHPFGSGRNRVMVILNAPRLLTKEEKTRYKDGSISLLKKIISAIELKYIDCYITNLIKCETDDPLLMPSQMADECRDILLKEIAFMKPEIVIVMGEILPIRKIINNFRNIAWYNIHHPITMLKNPDLKKPAWNTLKLVMKKMKEIDPL